MAHLHRIYDTDTHFLINPITREIKSESPSKTTLMQYDHNSERFTFQIPRYIEGHDMSLCDVVQIHFDNTDTKTRTVNSDVYDVEDVQLSPDSDDVVICSWLISRNATQYAGNLSFALRWSCTGLDGTEEYSWGTAKYIGISILESIHNGNTIVEKYSDILVDLVSRISYLEKYGTGGGSVSRIGDVTLLAADWVGDVSPYSQVVAIDGVTENTQVDLTPSVEQLAVFYEKDLAFVTENEGGIVTVYAIGQKPTNDYTIQVTMTEVSV